LTELAITSITLPISAVATSTIQYQTRTAQEFVAYTYGRIAQLQEIQKLLLNGNTPQINTLSRLDSLTF
jgi:hypothetical protein